MVIGYKGKEVGDRILSKRRIFRGFLKLIGQGVYNRQMDYRNNFFK